MRADAQRNRDRILAAAWALVAETGVDATMEEIARRAGVAVGTLYRHFPAKEDLVDAVVDDGVTQLAALTEAAVAAVHAGERPGPALLALCRRFALRMAADRVFKAAAGRLDIDAEIAAASPGSAIVRALDATAELLERAQLAAEIRADVTLADLLLLLSRVPGVEVSEAMRARFVEVMVAGLTA